MKIIKKNQIGLQTLKSKKKYQLKKDDFYLPNFLGSRYRGSKVLIRTLNQQKKILFSSKTFPFYSIQF
jgi:hypothetical protein